MFDVVDPDIEEFLEELKKKQATVSSCHVFEDVPCISLVIFWIKSLQ